METKGRRKSSNVEDRRGMSKGVIGGGIGGVGIIIVIIFTLLNGGGVGDLLNQVNQTPIQNGSDSEYVPTAEEEELAEFVSVVLADTEDVWQQLFEEQGLSYENPTLVLFTDSVQSGCGTAGAAVGPFYCPADQKLYIDLSFYQELKNRF
ncbi:MAG TPA: neutral zinc metallopeptidase, partial [Ureibacillus sp.]|nr:neutral zinc metallopeptidase [Ureibacillus sp.]